MLKFLIFFNPELHLKDTKSATKSKITDLLAKLKGSKFVTTLVLVVKIYIKWR